MDSVSTQAEQHPFRKWVLLALIVSLGLHFALYQYFKVQTLERFDVGVVTERLIPRKVNVKRAQIDPKLFEPEKEQKVEKSVLTEKQQVALPLDKPTARLPDTVKLAPNVTAPQNLMEHSLAEKPKVEPMALNKLVQGDTNAELEQELNLARDQLVSKEAPKIAVGSDLKLPNSTPGDKTKPNTESGDGTKDVPGFSNLDALLSQEGPLAGPVAPLNMPGGALFEYDSAALREDSIETLRKLGELIRRNPRSTFSIEGHTDSFGTPEYNQRLSEQRAAAVKAWLLANMGIDTSRIDAIGFGSTRLIAPATGDRAAQQMNRRVEIVIRTPVQASGEAKKP
jgi:outer membrane protein OmpA-like peptidoglycan-associated protein